LKKKHKDKEIINSAAYLQAYC